METAVSHWQETARPAQRREPIPRAGHLLALAAAIGLLAEALLHGQTMGLNVVLIVAALLGAGGLVSDVRKVDRLDLWLAPAALVFAALVALRGDPAVQAFDLLASLGLAGAALVALGGRTVTRRSVMAASVLAARAAGVIVAGSSWLLADARPWAAPLASLRVSGTVVGPVMRGLLLALPLLILFGALFTAADAVFARLVDDVVRLPELGELPGRAVLAGTIAWLSGGALVIAAGRALGDGAGEPVPSSPAEAVPSSVPRLGAVEALVALVALDLLFLVFVALQAAYLFGGRDTLATAGLTYSEYARRGFFELVAVAVLVGGVVLALEAVVARRSRAYVAAAVALVVLTGVVLASAALRLRLYQDAYGWTELRFHVLAAIIWLALCLVAAAGTLLTGRTRWLVHLVAALGLVVAGAVNIVGAQVTVTRENVARALEPSLVPPGGEIGFDAAYAASLGDDAVPLLVDALPRLPADVRASLQRALAERLVDLEGHAAATGWPSWNLSRQRALEALRAAEPQLRQPIVPAP